MKANQNEIPSLQILADAYTVSKFAFGFLVGRIYGWNYTVLTAVVAMINMKKPAILSTYVEAKQRSVADNSPIHTAVVPVLLGVVLFSEVMETCFYVIGAVTSRTNVLLREFTPTRPLYMAAYMKVSGWNDEYMTHRNDIVGKVITYTTTRLSSAVFGDAPAQSGFSLQGMAVQYVNNYLKKLFMHQPTSTPNGNAIGGLGGLGGVGGFGGALGGGSGGGGSSKTPTPPTPAAMGANRRYSALVGDNQTTSVDQLFSSRYVQPTPSAEIPSAKTQSAQTRSIYGGRTEKAVQKSPPLTSSGQVDMMRQLLSKRNTTAAPVSGSMAKPSTNGLTNANGLPSNLVKSRAHFEEDDSSISDITSVCSFTDSETDWMLSSQQTSATFQRPARTPTDTRSYNRRMAHQLLRASAAA